MLFLRIERTMQKRIAFLESLGVGDKLGKIIARAPNLLYTGVDDVLEPRVKYLQYVLGLSREEVRIGSGPSRPLPPSPATAAPSPPPRRASAPRGLRSPPAPALSPPCAVSPQVGRMTVKHPKLLTNGEGMVEKRLEFLFSLGLSDEAVKKIVRSHPQARAVAAPVFPSGAGRLSPSPGLPGCMFLPRSSPPRAATLPSPQVLNYSPESMQPRVEFLLDEVGLDEFEMSEVVTKLSTLFSLSVENSLRPKYHYLLDELGGSKDSLVSFPVYLSLSLSQRIQPRHRRGGGSAGSPPRPRPPLLLRRSRPAPRSRLSLRRCLRPSPSPRFLVEKNAAENPFDLHKFIPTDQAFAKKVNCTLEEYERFREGLAARAQSNEGSRLRRAPAALAAAAGAGGGGGVAVVGAGAARAAQAAAAARAAAGQQLLSAAVGGRAR